MIHQPLANTLALVPGLVGLPLQRLRNVALTLSNTEIETITPTELIQEFGFSELHVTKWLLWKSKDYYKEAFAECEKESIALVYRGDRRYPVELASIYQPPECLFLRGTLAQNTCIAFVGSRSCTSYGRIALEQLIPPLATYPVTIVSGLALGLDGIAHELALQSHLPTVAVLGTGIDKHSVYPREHAQLSERILEQGGCLLSEYPPHTGSRKEHFPQRNRIISGLSQVTVIVEAKRNSGSLITAKSALEQQREVLAVPGPIHIKQNEGSHQLIKMGAQLCDSASDIIDALKLERTSVVQHVRSLLPLSPEEQELYHVLDTSLDVDELCKTLQKSAHLIVPQLSLLELKGYIRVDGTKWCRSTIKR